MTSQNATAGANAGDGIGQTRELPEMLDVNDVAALLSCSSRHIYRLADMGRMPQPTKLGALCRWSRTSLLDWISRGCPSCRGGAR
jgi:excisionase family DNA binding protein